MNDDIARQRIKAEIARLLSEERKKCGLSMNLLAAKAGLSQSFVSSFEGASVNPALDKTPWNPTLDSLLRMAKVLKINPGEILKRAVDNVEKGDKR